MHPNILRTYALTLLVGCVPSGNAPSGFALRVRPSGSSVDATCSTWGDPQDRSGFALRVRPTGSPVALLGEAPRPSGFATCSTWGDPKTARGIRALDSPVAPLGETPRPQRGSSLALLGETPRPHAGYAHWLTTCSTWGDPKTLTGTLRPLGRPQDRTRIPHWLTNPLYMESLRKS